MLTVAAVKDREDYKILWRYDPREFAPGAAPARDARRRNATHARV